METTWDAETKLYTVTLNDREMWDTGIADHIMLEDLLAGRYYLENVDFIGRKNVHHHCVSIYTTTISYRRSWSDKPIDFCWLDLVDEPVWRIGEVYKDWRDKQYPHSDQVPFYERSEAVLYNVLKKHIDIDGISRIIKLLEPTCAGYFENEALRRAKSQSDFGDVLTPYPSFKR
jgi:hypothetical protein